MREHYKQNKERYAEHQRAKRTRNYEFVQEQKRGKRCASCGGEFPHYVMDFHHRDPADKRGSVTKLRASSSIQRIADEIAKCDLLCANCHRVVEYGEQPV